MATFTTLTNAGLKCLSVYVSDIAQNGSAPFYDLGPTSAPSLDSPKECQANVSTATVSIGPKSWLCIGERFGGKWLNNTDWFQIGAITTNTVLTPPAWDKTKPPPQMLFLDVNTGVITIGTTVAPAGFYGPPAPPSPPGPFEPSGGEYPYERRPSGVASWPASKQWAVFGGIGAGIVVLVLVIVLPVMLVKKNKKLGAGPK